MMDQIRPGKAAMRSQRPKVSCPPTPVRSRASAVIAVAPMVIPKLARIGGVACASHRQRGEDGGEFAGGNRDHRAGQVKCGSGVFGKEADHRRPDSEIPRDLPYKGCALCGSGRDRARPASRRRSVRSAVDGGGARGAGAGCR